MKKLILFLLIRNYCFGQNPDSKLEFLLSDSNNNVNFEFPENDTNILVDKTLSYSIKVFPLAPVDCGTINFGVYANKTINSNMISCPLGWCDRVSLLIERKCKSNTDTMKIFFFGMYQRSAALDIKFKKGTYEVNVKKLSQQNKLKMKTGYGFYIKSKYLLRKND